MRTCPECNNSYDDEVLHCPEDGLDLSHLEPQDELIGRSIGSYQITKVLGKGGMGSVYLAQHPVIGSRVAIKFLHAQYATDKKIVDRFFNEAKAVNVIGHDNILKILDLSVTDDNRHYFIMEFLNGKPLQDHVKPNEPMTLEVALPILLQCCEALQAAHDHQIIHRDLKPDNVYLISHKGKKNFVKVVDFGIAKLTDSAGVSTGKTQTGMVMGTPAYMSPEQAGGMTNMIDGRSDIYSLGVMMYQMLTGKLPFPGSSFGEVLIGHLQTPPPPPRGHNPSLPEELEAIILKALEKKQADRYQSMHEMHDAILDFMNRAGIPNELPPADALDITSAGVKMPTPGPMTARPKSQPGANKGRTAVGAGRTATSRSQPGKSMPPAAAAAPAPAPSRAGLYIGIGVAVLAIAGVVGYIVHDQNEKAAAEVARLARVAKEKDEQARIARERAKQAELEAQTAPIALAINSEPAGATVHATWKNGSATKETNFVLEVPKMSAVHLVFSKPNYLNYETDAVADQVKAVTAKLVLDPAKLPAQTAKAAPKPRKEKKREEAPAPDNNPDSTIPVEF